MQTHVLVAALLAFASAASGISNPLSDPDAFPIGVWLQQPTNAPLYQAIGVNLYVGLWQGPTDAQLSTLKAAGMPVICDQNAAGLSHLSDPTIVGWLQQDEPDNAQWNAGTQTYDPPVLPSVIQARYAQMKAADPSRPVLLNLGQGVAWDGWYGRGTRTNHPEDYAEYLKGADIGSFDIYPVASGDAAVKGQLSRVPDGVDRLNEWSAAGHRAFAFIETTNINGNGQATPTQVKSEVWLALIHGAKGIVYFAHQISPTFSETALLNDATMAPAVKAIDQQVAGLAPVLKSKPLQVMTPTASSNAAVTVDSAQKYFDGYRYLFAVPRTGGATTATFTVADLPPGNPVEVIGEARSVTAGSGGTLGDAFDAYATHLYRFRVPTWTVSGSGSVSDAASFSSTPSAAMALHFGSAATSGPAVVRMDRPMTVTALSFHNGSAGYTLSGTALLTLSSPFPTARVSVEVGSHTIDTPLAFATPGEFVLSAGTRLNLHAQTTGVVAIVDLAPTAVLDIGAGSLVIRYDLDGASTPGRIAALVTSGSAGGGWSGDGITSGAAATDAGHLTAVAAVDNAELGLITLGDQGVTANSFLLKYTYYGDTNLDGVVDAADLARLQKGFKNHLTGWSNGDFNYDNVVNQDDFGLFDRARARLGGEVTAAGAASAIPEPATGVLTAMGTLLVIGRRRRATN